jgi:hypothetical protein
MPLLTYEPTGVREEKVSSLAPRLSTLNDKTVGMLHNHKSNAREIATAITDILQERYSLKDVVGPVQVTGGVWISSKEQLDELSSKCDLVIVTLGD